MARDISESDDGNSDITETERAEASGNRSLIDRRSYLQLAGSATVAGAAMLTSSAGATAAADYDVIEADNSIYRLDRGETFENKVIDFSNGNSFCLYANTSDWEIRNVAFVGRHARDQHAIIVENTGGSGLIENVYMGDGCTRPDNYSSHGQCAIFVHRDHEGHVTIRHCNMQDWPNNGIYANAPHYENGGTVRIEECLAANNYVSNFRIGSSGSEVVDSVAYNDSNGQFNGRCLWAWGNDVAARRCAFDSGSYSNAIHVRGGTNLTVEDTVHDGYNNNGNVNEVGSTSSSGGADLTPPDGVPLSPEEAAGGASDGSVRSRGDHEDLQHIYEFDAEDDGLPSDYFFEVEEGPIEPSTYNGAEIEEEFMWVSDDGTRAAGRVISGRHAWEFDTNLVDATVEGDADPIINDGESHLDRYPLEGATGDDWKTGMPWQGDYPELMHNYEFVAEGDEPTDYYFEVEEGPIEPSTYRDSEIEEEFMWVSDDGTRAAGRLTGGRHAWEFDSNLVDATVEGSADVIINNTESNLDRYPLEGATGDDWKGDMPWHEDGYEHTILIDGIGTSGGTRYEFSVSGSVTKSTDGGATTDDSDVIDSGTVTGSVAGWRDAFRFTGELEELTVNGPARVALDGEDVDPTEYGVDKPHVLTIVGNGSPASYEVTVDGMIDHAPGEDLTDLTTISDDILQGSVEDDVQRFRFSGGISDITFIDGSAHVYVDDERVDPAEIGQTELLPHAIVIDGTEADGETSYSFEIDGDVIVANYRDASVDEGDVLEGTSVSGSVADSLDAYWFDGDIVDFTLKGDANVDVEYNARSE